MQSTSKIIHSWEFESATSKCLLEVSGRVGLWGSLEGELSWSKFYFGW
jgi:hypothetical protein